MVIVALGIKGGFTEVMGSDSFQFALTNGAVYGFVAGIVAFAVCYVLDLRALKAAETQKNDAAVSC